MYPADLKYTKDHEWIRVEGDTAVIAGDGNVYDAIDTKDSSSWGLSAGAHVNERFEVGFLFMQQMSTLRADGTNTLDIGDLDVTTYHPYIGFNFGAVDARIRPYAMIGFGATHFSSVSFTGITGLLPTCSTMPVCANVRKPASATSRRYGPSGRFGSTYEPDSSVTTSRRKPVSV